MNYLIPEPIGEVFCHRHRNGTMEHHESDWKIGPDAIYSHCNDCGKVAKVVHKTVKEFLEDSFSIELSHEPSTV